MNPFLTIWIHPKKTIEHFLTKEEQAIYFLPIIITGILLGLNIVSDISTLFGTGGAGILAYLISIGFGILFCLIGFAWLYPGLIKLVGKIWNGKATKTQLTNAVSLAQIPFVLELIYYLILIGFGDPDIHINQAIHYIIWIFYIRILLIGVAKAQGFSYGLAFLSIAIIAIPGVLISAIIQS